VWIMLKNMIFKFWKNQKRSIVILIVKEKWVGFINCRFSMFNLMFQESFLMLKTLKIYIWIFFINDFMCHFSISNVHQSLFLKLKRILILIIQITTWVELVKLMFTTDFGTFGSNMLLALKIMNFEDVY